MRKKVLISAYACEPGMGSEGGVGWNFVCQLAAKHDLWVLTRANNQEVIEADADPAVAGVNFVYVDLPRWLRFWKKGKRGHQLYYILWQIWILFATRKLRRELSFDLIHHITFGRYWIPSLLALARGNFVFGPVGGGESTPDKLAGTYSPRGRRSERLRDFVRGMVRWNPVARIALKRADVTLAATAQTAQALEKLGVNPIEVLPQSGISRAELDFFDEIHQPVLERPPRFVSACRHEHWKALHLSIRAVAQVCGDHPELRYHILSGGPERPGLEALVAELGVGEQVIFLGRLPTQEDVFKEMAGARLFLHPALHEAFGQACLEALALGVPVLCMDWGGPGIIVDAGSGFAIAPAAEEEVVRQMAEVIRSAVEQPERLVEMGESARARAREVFAWESLADRVDAVYQQLTPS